MSAVRLSATGLIHVLRADPDLAEAIAVDERDQAIEDCTAPELRVPTGSWSAEDCSMPPDAIGLLMLEGMLLRRVGIEGRYGAELLGEGDLLRPEPEDHSGLLPLSVHWTVIEPARFAMLDEAFARQLGRYPQLAGRLFARAVQRARNLAVNMAIVHHARVDVRLHMLFWHLAGRWGRVRGDGTLLPLRLTHTVLAELVAARRPTVTSALSDLARRGLVRSVDDAWLLSGDPPSERHG
jgi:CRP-like cAMP-binding protein